MKKLLLITALSVIVLASCKNDDTPNLKSGVIINGIEWAQCNVDKPGTFAANPEDPGMFYQFNRKVGWSATGSLKNTDGGTIWNTSPLSGSKWLDKNNPCPAGWRLPTKAEFESLLNSSVKRTWDDGKKGMYFENAGNTDPEKRIFLHAAGERDYTDGTLYLVDVHGCYWYNTREYMSITKNSSLTQSTGYTYGFSIRCVKK